MVEQTHSLADDVPAPHPLVRRRGRGRAAAIGAERELHALAFESLGDEGVLGGARWLLGRPLLRLRSEAYIDAVERIYLELFELLVAEGLSHPQMVEA